MSVLADMALPARVWQLTVEREARAIDLLATASGLPKGRIKQ